MHLHHIELRPRNGLLPQQLPDEVYGLLGALMRNGQICGDDQPVIVRDDAFVVFVRAPERTAFDPAFHNEEVMHCLDACDERGLAVRFVAEGREYDSAAPCSCEQPAAYVLFTHFHSCEPPVRCLDCFRPIPLYRLSGTQADDRSDLVSWMSNYRDCDRLQMGCEVLERPALRELSNLDSELSQRGRDLCLRLASACGRPFYYYLYRDADSGRTAERRRLCPGCRAAWHLDVPLHDCFDFRCDACALLSNLSWSQRI